MFLFCLGTLRKCREHFVLGLYQCNGLTRWPTILYCEHCTALCKRHIILYCVHRTVLFTLHCTVYIGLHWPDDLPLGHYTEDRRSSISTQVITGCLCTALHRTALHCPALRCTAVHWTAGHYAEVYYTTLYCIALYKTTLHWTKPGVITLITAVPREHIQGQCVQVQGKVQYVKN